MNNEILVIINVKLGTKILYSIAVFKCVMQKHVNSQKQKQQQKNITLKLFDPFCNCVDKGWHPIWKHRSILILLHFYGTELFCTSLK